VWKYASNNLPKFSRILGEIIIFPNKNSPKDNRR
jgi:hypothetical protein